MRLLSRGNSTRKVVPAPSPLSTESVASCASATIFTIASPRPAPWIALGRDLRAEEGLEDLLAVGRADPDAGVGDLEDRLVVLHQRPDLEPAAGRRELDRVGHEVVHELREPAAVAADREPVLQLADQLDARPVRLERRPARRCAPPRA
jgi:hypothetical protein